MIEAGSRSNSKVLKKNKSSHEIKFVQGGHTFKIPRIASAQSWMLAEQPAENRTRSKQTNPPPGKNEIFRYIIHLKVIYRNKLT